MVSNKETYSNYLLSRRWTGFWYRFIFIYPFFLRYLGNRCLDYGCGIGDFLKFASIFKINADGADVNKFNITICKKRGFNAYPINKKLILSNKKAYDSIILDNVIEHISDPTKTLMNLNSLIKKNGFLIIGIPVGIAGYAADSDHKVFYSERSLENLLRKNSFRKLKEFYRPFKNNYFRENLKQFCYYAVYTKI